MLTATLVFKEERYLACVGEVSLDKALWRAVLQHGGDARELEVGVCSQRMRLVLPPAQRVMTWREKEGDEMDGRWQGDQSLRKCV